MPRQKTYKLITERLLIRCYRPEDTPMVLRSINENLGHLRPWIPWAKKEPFTFEEKLERMRTFRGEFDLAVDFSFGIFDPEETMCLGGIGLHPRIGKNAREIGYWIHQKYAGKGYASEAVAAMTKIAFEVEQIGRVEIHCDPENYNSKKIPERLGYQLEAILKNRITNSNGELRDAMIWTLFREDYEKSTMKQTFVKAYDVMDNLITE